MHNPPFSISEFEPEIKSGKIYLHGNDKAGRSILVSKRGRGGGRAREVVVKGRGGCEGWNGASRGMCVCLHLHVHHPCNSHKVGRSVVVRMGGWVSAEGEREEGLEGKGGCDHYLPPHMFTLPPLPRLSTQHPCPRPQPSPYLALVLASP